MHANNETGVIQPVAEIAALCRSRDVLYHVDAVQSVGKEPLQAEAWGVDLVSVAAHKMGGPKGVGALWTRPQVPIRPLLPGAQERGIRGGTHNVPAIVGFGAVAVCAGSAEATTTIGRARARTPFADVLCIHRQRALATVSS